MARRAAAGIGDRHAIGEGRGRACSAYLTSGLAPALAALLVSGPAAAADFDAVFGAPAPPVALQMARWAPWVELGGTWGSEASSNGEVVVFAPLGQTPDSLVFTDIRGKVFESAILEGNLALGARRMLPSGWNVGAWGALDVRHTASDNTFGQVSGGIEALSEHFDLRLNGYLPLTGPQLAPGMADVILDGSNIFMVGGQEVPLAGVDAEVGARLPFAGNAGHVGVYGGGFWFDSPHIGEAVTGGRARFEVALNDIAGAGSRLTAQYEFVSDNVRGDRHLVGARLRIPLGATPQASTMPQQWLRMADRIERDVDIVIAPSGAEAVEDALTEVLFAQVAYVPDGGSVTDTSLDSGDNTLILVNGTVSGPQELQGNQTLQGGGSTIAVRGLTSGAVAGFTASGAAAMLDDPGTDVNLTLLGSNSHVAGIDIVGTPTTFSPFVFGNAAGISVPGPSTNVVIEQTSVADIGFIGISLGGDNSNVRIFDSTITNGGTLAGIFLGIDNSDIEIARVTVSETVGSGIFLGTGSRQVSISDTTVTGIGTTGIAIGNNASDVTIFNTTVSDISGIGILASSNNSDVTIAHSLITDTAATGIRFLDGNNDVTIAETTIADAGTHGIRFGDLNSNVTIAGATVTGAGANGIVFGNDNGSVAITDATIQQPGASGIAFLNGNSGVLISGATISGTGDNGIFFADSNTEIVITNTAISGTADSGIVLDENNSNVTIANTTVSQTGDEGIRIVNDNSNVTIAATTITQAAFEGILFVDRNSNVTITGTAVTSAGRDGILFGNDNGDVAIVGVTIQQPGISGIAFVNGNDGVSISGAAISGTGDNGIFFGNDNSNVAIAGTTITDTNNNGIQLVDSNSNVSIAATTVTDAGGDGIIFGAGNSVALNDSVLAGTFGDDGIDINAAGNILSGGSNTAAGAIFGGMFCEVTGAQTGSFGFVDDGTGNPGTCPP